MNQEPPQHTDRRIVLSSGKSVDLARIEESNRGSRRALYICPDCGSDLVQPIEWLEAVEDGWELVLGCPNCRWSDEGVLTEQDVQALEEQLDEGVAEMLRDLQRLGHANIEAQIDRFIAALQADLILPEDF